MAAVTKTTAQIAPVYSDRSEIVQFQASVAIVAGQPVTLNTAGKLILADANDANANHFIGVALESVGVGQVCAVLMRGHVYGFDISAKNAMTAVYVGDTVGEYADLAGTKSIVAGYVQALADGTKVLFVNGLVP